MERKDNDYSILLFFIIIWMMVGGIAQCESARELGNIRHELRMMDETRVIKTNNKTMGKKIYIVTSGEYSDYCINAMFTTKEKAVEYVEQHGTYYDIEEYDLDKEVEKKNQLWSIVFCIEDSKFNEANPISYNKNKKADICYVEERFRGGKMYYIIFLVDAGSMDRAVKIARERFAAVKSNEYIWFRLTRPYETDRYRNKYERFNVKTNEFIK